MEQALLSKWLAAVDRPALEALRLGRGPFRRTVAIGVAGAMLAGAASLGAEALLRLGGTGFVMPEGRLLAAGVDALLLSVPSALVLAAFARLRLDSRAFLAAVAIGLLVAGVVTSATLPLFGYLALVSRAQPLFTPDALLPILAIAAVGATVARVLKAVEDDSRGRVASVLFQLSLYGMFVVRAVSRLELL